MAQMLYSHYARSSAADSVHDAGAERNRPQYARYPQNFPFSSYPHRHHGELYPSSSASSHDQGSRQASESHEAVSSDLTLVPLDSPYSSSDNMYSPSYLSPFDSPTSIALSRSASEDAGFDQPQTGWLAMKEPAFGHPATIQGQGPRDWGSNDQLQRAGVSWQAPAFGPALSIAGADSTASFVEPATSRLVHRETYHDHAFRPPPYQFRPSAPPSYDHPASPQWSSSPQLDMSNIESIFPFDQSLFATFSERQSRPLPHPSLHHSHSLSLSPVQPSSNLLPSHQTQPTSLFMGQDSSISTSASSAAPQDVTELRAAAKRSRPLPPAPLRLSPTASTLGSISNFPSHPNSATESDQVSASRKVVKKLSKDEDCVCTICSVPLARLILRATKEKFGESYSHAYTCFTCEPREVGGSPVEEKRDSDVKAGGKDRLKANTFRKRTKRSDGTNLVSCDVCLRDIMSGAVFSVETNAEVEFAVEVVCASCTTKYQRCSDCGGGGAVMLLIMSGMQGV